jgi:hypothetical protein
MAQRLDQRRRRRPDNAHAFPSDALGVEILAAGHAVAQPRQCR